jgi:hypothetical protein
MFRKMWMDEVALRILFEIFVNSHHPIFKMAKQKLTEQLKVIQALGG